MIKLYLAPLEGITGYVFRNAFHTYFGGVDKYFIPFIMPNQFGRFSSRENKDILPEHNKDFKAIPQILTNDADDFIRTAKALMEIGYGEINLNLGCPSKTVVSKRRGSGFLAEPDKLERFLEQIFADPFVKISIKTRIGKDDPDEFEELLEIYNKFPMEELIIHPRIQQDFYKNTPNLDVFETALKASKNPVCYNGDIFTLEDYQSFVRRFPTVETVMLGRGLLRNPGLAEEIKDGLKIDKVRLRKFHDRLYQDYQEVLSGEKTVLFKMKEIWCYLAPFFADYEKCAKKIKKAQRLPVYEEAVAQLFEFHELG